MMTSAPSIAAVMGESCWKWGHFVSDSPKQRVQPTQNAPKSLGKKNSVTSPRSFSASIRAIWQVEPWWLWPWMMVIFIRLPLFMQR